MVYKLYEFGARGAIVVEILASPQSHTPKSVSLSTLLLLHMGGPHSVRHQHSCQDLYSNNSEHSSPEPISLNPRNDSHANFPKYHHTISRTCRLPKRSLACVLTARDVTLFHETYGYHYDIFRCLPLLPRQGTSAQGTTLRTTCRCS